MPTPVIRYRSVWDNQQYNDDEYNTEPSLTDPSQHVTIQQILARVTRGEYYPPASGLYDFEDEDGVESKIDLENVLEKRNFDLSDLDIAKAKAKEAEAMLMEIERREKEARDVTDQKKTAGGTPEAENKPL